MLCSAEGSWSGLVKFLSSAWWSWRYLQWWLWNGGKVKWKIPWWYNLSRSIFFSMEIPHLDHGFTKFWISARSTPYQLPWNYCKILCKNQLTRSWLKIKLLTIVRESFVLRQHPCLHWSTSDHSICPWLTHILYGALQVHLLVRLPWLLFKLICYLAATEQNPYAVNESQNVLE